MLLEGDKKKESINTWVHTMSGGINASKTSAAGGRTKTDARALLPNDQGRPLWGRPLSGDLWRRDVEMAGSRKKREQLERPRGENTPGEWGAR